MTLRRTTHSALVGALFALAGCGSSQTPTMPQTLSPAAAKQAHHASWMLPGTSYKTLLYVALPFSGQVNIYAFPGGQQVGELTGFLAPEALCSDSKGNIWVGDSDGYSSQMDEFAHGGTSKIATLSDSVGAAWTCSVDARTGNLAVANLAGSYECAVAIWAGATGNPTVYQSPAIWYPNATAYDNRSDLFLAGFVGHSSGSYSEETDWLAKGASGFSKFKVKPTIYPHVGIAIDNGVLTEAQSASTINRYKLLRNHHAKYVGSLSVNMPVLSSFGVHTTRMVGVDNQNGDVYFFNYPQGGNPTYTLTGLYEPGAVAFSDAKSKR